MRERILILLLLPCKCLRGECAGESEVKSYNCNSTRSYIMFAFIITVCLSTVDEAASKSWAHIMNMICRWPSFQFTSLLLKYLFPPSANQLISVCKISARYQSIGMYFPQSQSFFLFPHLMLKFSCASLG